MAIQILIEDYRKKQEQLGMVEKLRKRKLKPRIHFRGRAWDNGFKVVVIHSKIGDIPCINSMQQNKNGLA